VALPALQLNATLEEPKVDPGDGFSITAGPVGGGVGVAEGVGVGVGMPVVITLTMLELALVPAPL
jgi:hypothetical protein